MASVVNGNPKDGDVLLLVGTRKGAFVLSSDEARKKWRISGPHFTGSDVYHVTHDPRGDGAIFSAVNNPIWGSEVQRSYDLGKTWQSAGEGPAFKKGTEKGSVNRVWHVEPGRASEPNVVYAGVDPAALFRSDDGGVNWTEITSLTNHSSRPNWQPGFGGLCLHSMVLDPANAQRMWVGISSVGVFGTNDNGKTWNPMNKGVRADFAPDPFPEYGQCTHKMLSHATTPNVLYQQNHCGFFRSDNGGSQWLDLSDGLPSRFGFVMGIHSKDPKTVYVLPEDRATTKDIGGGMRFVSDAKFRVFRSRNGGADWQPLTKGLPQQNAYLHTMREGMATDSFDSCGIYIGATSGQIFYSRDDGENWEMLIDNLPPINSVEIGKA